mmetsp:Transcript_20907/g.29515  ORF Transcript_20907/g.29515 Transcript_20907/m.29515 type:complete len:797 (+) Transcript_20907:176-2566(+)
MLISHHPRRQNATLLLLSCFLFSKGNAFYVTPWTRIPQHRYHDVSSLSAATTRQGQERYSTTSSSSSTTLYATSQESRSSSMETIVQLERDIVKLGRRGKTDDALQLYKSIEYPTIRQMNGAIDACARARPTRLKEAHDIFHHGIQHFNLKPNVFTFGSLMSACARARQADQALQLLKSMKTDYGVEPNAVVYSTAISACARAEPAQPKQALELLRQAPKNDMNVVGYNAALSACASAGQWEPAIDLLREMEQQQKSGHGVVCPDAVSYGTVLAACERAGKWDMILHIAKEIMQNKEENNNDTNHDNNDHRNGVVLDGMSLTSVLHACQQLGLPDEAMYYLEIMKTSNPSQRKTMGLQRKGAKRPIKGADAVAYRLAISACARGGNWQQGIRLLEEMKFELDHYTPDVMAYTSAITGCEYAGEWKRAFGLVDAMRKDGVEPNVVTFAAVIGACATACANAGRMEQYDAMALPKKKALQLLKVMKMDNTIVDPNINVYNAAIRVCAEAMDLDGAMTLLDQLEEEGLEPTQRTFGSLVTACERVESSDALNKVFRRMRDASITPNEIIYGAAISCCRKAGEPERTLLLLRKMIREGLSPNIATFNTVIMAQTEGGGKRDMERAILTYKIMKSKKHSHASVRPNRQTYTLIVTALASKKQPREAELFLRKMRSDGYVPDVDLYTTTVTAYERLGQPLEAVRLMETMREDGYDFYEVKVLNAAFKRAVKIVNVVGQGLRPPGNEKDEDIEELVSDDDVDDIVAAAVINDDDDENNEFDFVQLDFDDDKIGGFLNGTDKTF